ncbi:nitrous oxide reductase family maturation protein NosD [Shumkonia mesophila]|uniref:nitrous oxide reductase family maturation protein NosD n=1 Tax=Shumkonia mesophila TaxID=2838854 RepID=UPI002934957D|nr:nitrous oxide reductase family maturation protein NosD [Shumkonia mesophila]
MTRKPPLALMLVALAAAGIGLAPARAQTVVPLADRADLAAAVAAAAAGSTLRLAAGVYRGPVMVDRPLTLEGEPGAIVEGVGRDSVIVVKAPGTVIRGLTIRGSGTSLAGEDAGIFVEKTATGTLIEGNVIEGNLFGVFLKGSAATVVRNNRIAGRQDLRMSERGNGVHLWNAPGAKVIANDIQWGRDGIFVTTSERNEFAENRFSDLRFAIHYMYTNRSTVRDNVSIGNHVGYALMFSKDIEVLRNLSQGDRDHGLLFNYANDSTVAGNAVIDGGEKCVFIYNANKNVFRGNHFQGCGIGIHFTAGSERNTVSGNAFIGNRFQVKYVGSRDLVWTEGGAGNYWSDQPSFDLNGDGIADQPYRPNGLIDHILWRVPRAKLLLTSPALQVLKQAQAAFPAILPGGVVDTAPLMRPPSVAAVPSKPRDPS